MNQGNQMERIMMAEKHGWYWVYTSYGLAVLRRGGPDRVYWIGVSATERFSIPVEELDG